MRRTKGAEKCFSAFHSGTQSSDEVDDVGGGGDCRRGLNCYAVVFIHLVKVIVKFHYYAIR